MTTLQFSMFPTFSEVPNDLCLSLGKSDDTTVGTCIANDGYGRQCQNKRLANCLYCASCWNETRPIGLSQLFKNNLKESKVNSLLG